MFVTKLFSSITRFTFFVTLSVKLLQFDLTRLESVNIFIPLFGWFVYIFHMMSEKGPCENFFHKSIIVQICFRTYSASTRTMGTFMSTVHWTVEKRTSSPTVWWSLTLNQSQIKMVQARPTFVSSRSTPNLPCLSRSRRQSS